MVKLKSEFAKLSDLTQDWYFAIEN
jgi:hypothetical protein